MKFTREIVVKCASYWRKVTFTDDKRWCLHGPDGYNNYWADKRLEREVFSMRVNGGGVMMVWAGAMWRGKTGLAFLSKKIGAVKYCKMLDEFFQPYVEKFYPNGVVFLQEGAPAHTVIHKKDYFTTEDMLVMEWPARSPDFNIIENV